MSVAPFASIADAARALRAGSVTAVALTESMLARIDAHDQTLNAFVTVLADTALAAARAADDELARGVDRGPLHGIPIAIKDLIDTAGVRTTYGAKRYADHVPAHDATVVSRLRAAGAINVGKTGLHEFAYGMTSINDFYGAVRNPWALDHIAGGSSGGSAAAVAAGLSFGAVGTDTGCSIRQPAHCCGIVGLKPTFGLVSKTGVYPLCWTMDHVGPMTRTVADAALMLGAMAGFDADDPFSIAPPAGGFLDDRAPDVSGMRIGVIRDFFFDGREDVIDVVGAALAALTAAGAELVEFDVAGLDETYRICRQTFVEALAIHATALAAAPIDYSEQVRDKLLAARKISAVDYARSQQARRELRLRMERLLNDCDVLAAPTSTIAAVPIDDIPDEFWHLAPRNTGIADFTGQPSISLPCGRTPDNLPVGLMLTGPVLGDRELLGSAHAVETALGGFVPPPAF